MSGGTSHYLEANSGAVPHPLHDRLLRDPLHRLSAEESEGAHVGM
jgi:hypothetical protein